MAFKETVYSLPPLHIYQLDDGGTREVCGDIQKISTGDGHMVVLDSRGIVSRCKSRSNRAVPQILRDQSR